MFHFTTNVYGLTAEDKRQLDRIEAKLDAVINLEKKMNQSITDAIKKLNDSVSAELKAISAKLSQPDADTPAIVAALNDVTAKLDEETAALTTTPPPVTT